MAKQLVFDEEASRSLKKGIDILAGAVKTTLGTKGRNVALDKKFGAPTVTHDGVTVAKEIQLENAFENMGAQLLKEAATKTNDVAGDGTTTATVLAQAIANEGMRNIAAGTNAMLLKRGIDRAAAAVVAEIKAMAVPGNGKEDIARVASSASCSRPRASASSPRTSTARRWRPWSSTRCAARSTCSRSRRLATVTAARPCSRTSRS